MQRKNWESDAACCYLAPEAFVQTSPPVRKTNLKEVLLSALGRLRGSGCKWVDLVAGQG